MSEDRREAQRDAEFHNLELVTADATGTERSYPIILRDRSGNGLGAMYIGKEVLSPAREFLLRGGGEGDRKVRIVWTKQVADFVVMMGMELVEA